MSQNARTGSGCARVRARLAVALDGALDPFEAALDRGHLEACAECRGERDQHARLLASIHAASTPSAGELELVTAEVLARLAAARPLPSVSRWSRHAGVVAAAAAGLLLVLLTALGSGSPLRPLDPADLDPLRHRLPSWSDVVRGLDSLSRLFS